jgi:elongation factor P--(R)-beta-lysine ligase
MLTPQGLRQRANLLQALRTFFIERDYVEVDTPQRLPVLIPESNLVPFSSEDCFLHTSPELCMKRLLARGCSRIFQICHCFRKEEHGRLHQSEFTMLEWYHKGWDYLALMRQCEELIYTLVRSFPDLPGVAPGEKLCWRDSRVAMTPPWDRLTVAEAFQRYADMDVNQVLRKGNFDTVLVTKIEPHLGQERPVFLYDYPIELGSLARSSQKDPTVAERVELYIAGVELANGFSELVDPQEQRHRFISEMDKLRSAGKDTVLPEKFLAELNLVGETAGMALGVDRLCMLLMGSSDIMAATSFIFEEL